MDRRKNALNAILRVGTSAGGARAKAVIAWNPETNEVRSGQVAAGKGFGYWLLKFDGVTGNKDDVTYSYNPAGIWTATHQMTMNGKRDGFTLADFRACAKNALMKRGRAETIVDEVRAAVAGWPDYAEQAQVANDWHKQIQRNHRLVLPKT